MAVEMYPPRTYLPSSTFEINEFYFINIIITSISMNRNLLNGNKEMNMYAILIYVCYFNSCFV